MRLSKLFTSTTKNVPADETSKNAQLLMQAGFIHKEMAGVYAYLPLGLKVLENIKTIVREEMNALDSNELIMTGLQRKELWESTGRWDDKAVDVWFKSELKNGTQVGFGWSHEEPITNMMKNFVTSYRNLPASVYQFQTKLRNELRAKSGIMRGREFVMKDMYILARSQAENEKLYNDVKAAYLRVFERVGLGEITYVTAASGGSFTKYSHEFQTITDAGEDVIYVNRAEKLAINEEVYNDEALAELGIEKEGLEKVKAAEVGNIFNFGTEKSEKMDFTFDDEAGQKQFVHLSSYGIGITRLMGVIAEVFADDKGLVWPENIAPAKVYLARLGDSAEVVAQADELYNRLTVAGTSVLYDDRDIRPGQKFGDADLLGIPHRLVISDKTIAAGTVELKARTAADAEQVTVEKLAETLGIPASTLL
ncbi:prolyl-tRNA synthetase [Polaromonas sp.]|nr:prolyl-tRNA synthetase [Candidatus Saccharibacteria bacterium]